MVLLVLLALLVLRVILALLVLLAQWVFLAQRVTLATVLQGQLVQGAQMGRSSYQQAFQDYLVLLALLAKKVILALLVLLEE
jgi:hypothetical protein